MSPFALALLCSFVLASCSRSPVHLPPPHAVHAFVPSCLDCVELYALSSFCLLLQYPLLNFLCSLILFRFLDLLYFLFVLFFFGSLTRRLFASIFAFFVVLRFPHL